MPVIEVKTNTTVSKEKKLDFCKKASPFLAKLLSKPEQYVCVILESDVAISFAGDDTSPAALVRVSSVGRLGLEENKKHSAKIAKFIEEELSIPSNRYYIFFTDLPGQDTGFSGSTFA